MDDMNELLRNAQEQQQADQDGLMDSDLIEDMLQATFDDLHEPSSAQNSTSSPTLQRFSVKLHIGTSQLSREALENLEPGSLIKLEQKVGTLLKGTVSDNVEFEGKLGTLRNQYAVQIKNKS